MKKLIKNTIAGLTLLTSLIFTGCFNPVYFNILNDVTPLQPTVTGSIRAITRYTTQGTDFLVVATDEGIKYKNAAGREHGQWKNYTIPGIEIHHYDYYTASDHVGHQLLVTHADVNTLYVVTVEYKDDEEEGIAAPSAMHIFAKQISLTDENTWSDEGEWKDVLANDQGINYTPFYKDSSAYLSAFAIFSTNAVQPAHRKVYLRSGDINSTVEEAKTVKYYEISGLNTPVEVQNVSPADYSNTEKNNANSAVYFNGGVQFLNSIAATTNETASKDATVMYYGFEKDLYYKRATDSEFTKSAFGIGQPASCLCVCKDSLIIGRANFNSTSTSATGGVVKTTLDEDGIIGSALGTFDSNIETQLHNAYFIMALINVDPSQTEAESALYSTIDFIGTGSSTAAKYKELGLWSYYPERGNWNRE